MVSAKIPDEMHQQLVKWCNELDCTLDELVEKSLKIMLNNGSDFKFQLGNSNQYSNSTNENQTPKKLTEGRISRIIDDNGNVIMDNSDNR